MAQDAREPYYDDTGSTHSVSTASDLHEQVSSNDRANWLAGLFPSSNFALHDSHKRKREVFVVRLVVLG